MRFRGLDLNSVYALDVLLAERSVSRAAERLHLSQPAISATLARLREFFNDELLVQSGRQMIPTAFSATLQPAIREFLGKAEILVSSSSHFQPEESKRNFRLGASDYISMVLITPLLRRLADEAPHLTFDIVPPSAGITQRLERGEIDCILSPREFLSDRQPSEMLFQDTHVIVGDKSNPLLQKAIGLQAFLDAPQVAIAVGPAQELTFAERHLVKYRDSRRIEIVSPSFSGIGYLLSGTRRIAVVQQRLAKILRSNFPLAMQALPLKMPPLVEMAQYHSTRANDPGLRWLLREMQAELSGEV